MTGDLPIRQSVAKLPGYSKFIAKYPGDAMFVQNLSNATQVRPVTPLYPKISTAIGQAVQGVLPCSDGERQVLLVAASIADGIPVDLREAALCMDGANAARAAQAVCHAAGRRVAVVAEAGR
jgi:hypothetical protein